MVEQLAQAVMLENQFGDRYLHPVNGATFNQVGAKLFYQSHFAGNLFIEDTFYLIVGTDSGLLPRYIAEAGSAKGSRYLFIELPAVISKIREDLICHDQFYFAHGENWQQVAKEKAIENYLSLDQTRLLRSIAVLDGHLLDYRYLSQQVEHEYQALCWKVRVSFAGFTFIQQQLQNICENQVPALAFANAFKGKTGLLLAGGPSLDEALPWALEHREQVLIVAVSRISRRLLEVGLIPDIIVSIDPSDKMFAVSKEMLQMPKGPLLVNGDHVSSLLLASWPGPHAYLGERFPWKTEENPDNLICQGPTVTNSAINLMITMGCDKILIAGMDLAYSSDGYSHAKGSDEHRAGPRLGFIGHPVPLNDGTMGETESAFYLAIETVAQQGEIAKSRSCQLINLSAQGAKIPGVEFCNIDAVEISPLTVPAEEIIQQVLQQQQSESPRKFIEYCLKQVEKLENEVRKSIALAQEARKINEKLADPKKQQKCINEISKIEAKLEKKKAAVDLLKVYGYKEFIGVYHPKPGETWSAEEIKKAGYHYFNGCIVSGKELLKTLAETKDRINSRLDELKKNPNVERLALQWLTDRCPQRGLHWLWQRGLRIEDFPMEQQGLLNELVNAQQNQMAPRQTAEVPSLRDYDRFRNVQHKLYLLYKQQKTSDLEKICKQLQQIEEEEAEVLGQLAAGYLSEISGDEDKAIEHYYSAANGHAQEIALSHLSSLLLKKQDTVNARLSLECLVTLSPGYLPQYAQLCALLGDIDTSIQAYLNYLDNAPDDVAVKQRLLLLYQRCGRSPEVDSIHVVT